MRHGRGALENAFRRAGVVRRGETPHMLGLTPRQLMWWCPVCECQMRDSYRTQHLVEAHRWSTAAQARIRARHPRL